MIGIRRRIYGSFALPLLVAAALFSGCGDTKEVTEDPPVVMLTEDGWDRYSAGDLTGAREKFEDAISADGGVGLGYNGLGWVQMELGELESALASFDLAIAKGFRGADASAGRALILYSMNEYGQAILAGHDAVARDPSFKLPGNTRINILDVRLMIALSEYERGAFEAALAQVRLIDTGLAPINAFSATFVEELTIALDQLANSLL